MKIKHTLIYSGIFAVLVLWVFWGTWSTDFSPVMPDNGISHTERYANVVWAWIANFISTGKFIPTDIVWSGLLISPYFCQELKYAVGLYFSGLALAYFLLGRGLRPLAAYGAGLLLAFCGYWSTLFSAGHGGWFIWMTYGVFAFGLVDRAIKFGKLRHWLLLGLVIAWAMYYQPDLWLMFTIFTGIYLIFRLARARMFPWRGILAAAAVFFLVGGPAISGAIDSVEGREKQIEESSETMDASGKKFDSQEKKDPAVEREKRWIFVTNWSLPTDELAEFFIPGLNGDTSCPLTLALGTKAGTGIKPYTGAIGRAYKAPAGNYRQHSVYVGWMTCLLAIAGLVGLRRMFRQERGTAERDNAGEVVFFAVAALICILLSLGRYCEPLYRCVFALPVGDLVRCPVKWHHLTEFCLVVLAGYGLDWLLSLQIIRNELARTIAVGALIAIGAINLAIEDHKFCAPVDLTESRRQNASFQMTFMGKNQFANPQIAEMVRQRRIVSLGYYPGRNDIYLVGVLEPRGLDPRPKLPDFGFPTVLGFVSIISALTVIAACFLRKI